MACSEGSALSPAQKTLEGHRKLCPDVRHNAVIDPRNGGADRIETVWDGLKQRIGVAFWWNPGGTPGKIQAPEGQKVTSKSLFLWRTQEDLNL